MRTVMQTDKIPAYLHVPDKFPMKRMLVGLIFLFNPSWNLMDILPDFIGCLLILSALALPSELAPYFADAKERFQKLVWLELSKIPAFLLMMTIYAGDVSQRSIIAVFAITYAILELLFLIPAFRFLLGGFFYLGERFGCSSAIRSDDACRPEELPRILSIFFFLRALGACLPEFALVPTPDALGENRFAYMMLRAYPFFVLVAFAIVLGFGIYSCVRLFRYLCRLRRDPELPALFRSLAEEKHASLMQRHEMNNLRLAVLLLMVGSALSIDLTLDNFNLLPDIMAAAVFFVAIKMLAQYLPRTPLLLGVTVGYGLLSLVSTVLSAVFYNSYTQDDLYDKVPEALAAYRRYLLCSYAELALALALALVLVYVLIRMIPIASDSFGECDSRQTLALRRSMRRESLLFTLLFALASLARTFELYLAQFSKRVVLSPELAPDNATLGGTLVMELPLIEWFWMVPLTLSLAAFAVMLHLTGRFRAEAEETFSEYR